MWTAQIESKTNDRSVLFVGVQYTDGTKKFGESIDMTGGDIDTLNNKIQARLNTLNANDTLVDDITLGAFTPPTIKPVDEKEAALTELRKLQDLVNLGVLKESDQQVLDAIADVKAKL